MPAAAHAVGPRYPISWLPSKSAPAAASDPPLVTDTATSCDYPRHSHRKPAGRARQRSRSARRDIAGTVIFLGDGPPYPPKSPQCRPMVKIAIMSGHIPPAKVVITVLRSGGLAEVLGRDLVEELPKLLDLVLLLVGDGDASLVEDLVGREDRGTGPQCQGDRVRGPGAGLGAVGEDEVRVEDPVAQGGDVDRAELHVQDFEHVLEQVVGQRPQRHHALLSEGDRGRLHRPDPDGQVPVTLLFFQQDDRAVGRHLDTDADDLHPPHWSSALAPPQRRPVPLY